VNAEICAQVIVALTELNIPLDDPRFVKDGNTLIDVLLTFHIEGKGFVHTLKEAEAARWPPNRLYTPSWPRKGQWTEKTA
jgi:hypothetical protein